jgi:sugar phosphate isomerase/epimerase
MCLATLGFAAPLCAGEAPEEGLPNPFFALVNCVQCDEYATRDAQAKLLKELGYEGVAPSGTAGVAEMLRAFDEHDLPMTALYVRSDLDPQKPKYDAALPEVIRTLKGRDTFLWLFILRGPFKSASPQGDRRAVAIVREVAAMCEASGVRVALYPHAGFYVERVEDAVRVAEKVDRPNVGVTFNLCHWLKVDEPSSMERLVKLAAPHLYLVTINGADRDGKSWDRLIQPLDRGTFDVGVFLEALREVGYQGPIGLQCYAVPGDKRENLRRSMDAWRKLSKRVGGE